MSVQLPRTLRTRKFLSHVQLFPVPHASETLLLWLRSSRRFRSIGTWSPSTSSPSLALQAALSCRLAQKQADPLCLDSLLHIASFFVGEVRYDKHSSPQSTFYLPGPALISFGSTCRAIRSKLGSMLWRCLLLGQYEPTDGHAGKLRHPADTGSEMLPQVRWVGRCCEGGGGADTARRRHICVLNFLPNAVTPIAECISVRWSWQFVRLNVLTDARA